MAKVLVVAPYVPHPSRHGGAIRSRVLLDALGLDHEVHLAAAVATEVDRLNLRALAAETGFRGHELPARDRPRARALPKLLHWAVGRSELAARRWAAGAADAMRRIAGEVAADLTVVDSTFALPVLSGRWQLLALHNLEFAALARRDDEPRSWTERTTRRIEARRLGALERRAIARSALTVTVSAHDRALALGLVPAARVEVVPNSVDLARLSLLPPADPRTAPRVLFVGSLDYPPNLAAAIELVERHAPALRAAFPGLVVRLVGKDPAGFGARFAGVPGIEVVGTVDDVVPHYRASHAVYLPIQSGGGTRIKILEAWALGVPVLSTAVGAEGLPAADGVHLLRFETPAEGATALRRVLAGEGATLREHGRALVEQQFSHAAAIARLRQLVGELLPH